jgi:hypothetical protein
MAMAETARSRTSAIPNPPFEVTGTAEGLGVGVVVAVGVGNGKQKQATPVSVHSKPAGQLWPAQAGKSPHGSNVPARAGDALHSAIISVSTPIAGASARSDPTRGTRRRPSKIAIEAVMCRLLPVAPALRRARFKAMGRLDLDRACH